MGIPCGGSMSVIVEPHMIDSVILIRGEGRIVEVLCSMAKLLNFKIIIHTSKSNLHSSKSNEELYPDADKIIPESLNVEEIEIKQRSLASVRRARLKEKKNLRIRVVSK